MSLSAFIVTLLLAIVVFVLPLLGIRDQIEREKQRTLDETNDLLLAASDRLHRRVAGDNYQNMRDTKDAIAALVQERELFERVSTWPWASRTLRGFASTLLLPIFLLLVSRLLEIVF